MKLNTIKKGVSQFVEQSALLSAIYPTKGRLYYIIDMSWCLLRYGATPLDYTRFEFYKKRRQERNKYLTLYRYFKLVKKMYESLPRSFCGDKSFTYKVYGEYIKRDWIYADSTVSDDEVKAFIESHNSVIVKPVFGEQGRGVFKIKSGDIDQIDSFLKERATAPYMVEEVVQNEKAIANIHPQSLNTIRCFTFIDKNGSAHIMEIMLRTGTHGSHVDNWGAGGIAWSFDIETGICVQCGIDKKNSPYIYHPDSHVLMVGYSLPHFEELKKYVLSLCNIEPKARYVGWDIAYTEKGFDLIEMNCPGGHDILQAFGRPWGDFIKKNW